MWLRELICPRDYAALIQDERGLCCERGHVYPLVDGIPIMLRDDVR